ncbi:copper amine oxidase N-terminal domain-containing protein [Paenibacillus faecalis]|uniref:copper amine oxidase N-terminal domain-containing protein n=1 Tax=Paenibacillus faecalis TaxID=2079532 RepID=UPI000D0F557D|nr:copper amine oxidase N-terminal domain-containing protein [Paenibacillus faecalis]
MKRFSKVGLISITLLAMTFSAVGYAASKTPKIILNSNEIKNSAQPKIINGSVYVPIRSISEGFGTEITWDNKSKTVYVNSDPDFKDETVNKTTWVVQKNMITKFIMGYDERNSEDALKWVTKDFKTDIYKEFPTGGAQEMNSIIDHKFVDYQVIDHKGTAKFTVQIVMRPYGEEYNIKQEKWEFVVTDRIKSAKIVPKSTKYLERYTVVPNVTFGE